VEEYRTREGADERIEASLRATRSDSPPLNTVRICMGSLKINLSQAFAGQGVGVKTARGEDLARQFMQYDLGFFDHETCRIENAENSFAALPVSPE
jgi:hypothetical protein